MYSLGMIQSGRIVFNDSKVNEALEEAEKELIKDEVKDEEHARQKLDDLVKRSKTAA